MRRAGGAFFTRPFVAGAVLLIAGTGVLGFFLWLRDSSLVRVEHVKITGLTTQDSPAIRRTLRQAAMRMTTLHYDAAALEQAVEAFPAVESVSASADLQIFFSFFGFSCGSIGADGLARACAFRLILFPWTRNPPPFRSWA